MRAEGWLIPPLLSFNLNKNMQIANAWVVLNREGSSVEKKNITPAEALVLRKMFEPVCGSNPVTLLSIHEGQQAAVITARDPETGKVTKSRLRTPQDELRRLKQRYGPEKVIAGKQTLDDLFPGAVPNMSATFEEAGFEEGLAWQAPDKSAANANAPGGRIKEDDFAMIDAPEDYRRGGLGEEVELATLNK